MRVNAEVWVDVEWEVVPYVRFGPVSFDMTRDEVREVLGPPEAVVNLMFHYGLLATVVFDSEGRCNWVATSPGRPVRASVLGIELVGDHDEVVGRLAEQGHKARQGLASDAGSTYVDDLGVLLGREDVDEPELDTVAAYRRGYWDDWDA